MKEFKNLLFENQDGLGILTMNRPAALNALNKDCLLYTSDAADE